MEAIKIFLEVFICFTHTQISWQLASRVFSAITSKFNFDDVYIATPPAKLEALAITKLYPGMLILMSGLLFSRVSVIQIIPSKTVNCEIKLIRLSKLFCRDQMFKCETK